MAEPIPVARAARPAARVAAMAGLHRLYPSQLIVAIAPKRNGIQPRYDADAYRVAEMQKRAVIYVRI